MLSREVLTDGGFRLVAGVDVAYLSDEEACVVACALSTGNWSVVNEQRVVVPVSNEHQSGILDFRWGPLMLKALIQLPTEPDLVLVNGTGIAHPRRFGLACHVGLSLDHPTIGVVSTWPTGCARVRADVARRRGSKVAILHEDTRQQVGWELVTQENSDPVYVSPGHRVGLEEAAVLVLRSSPWYRLPEPLRAAERAVKRFLDGGRASSPA
jgi:deoxyribonuclease V